MQEWHRLLSRIKKKKIIMLKMPFNYKHREETLFAVNNKDIILFYLQIILYVFILFNSNVYIFV